MAPHHVVEVGPGCLGGWCGIPTQSVVRIPVANLAKRLFLDGIFATSTFVLGQRHSPTYELLIPSRIGRIALIAFHWIVRRIIKFPKARMDTVLGIIGIIKTIVHLLC